MPTAYDDRSHLIGARLRAALLALASEEGEQAWATDPVQGPLRLCWCPVA
jgi:hypothetical protein